MATPDRAPRRTAAQMSTNIASGIPVPGANASTYNSMRKTASVADANTYNKQRAAGNCNLGPTTFPDTKVNK